jgi:hypothetical protein
MGIKVKNVDSNSVLRKTYFQFDTANTATGAQVCNVVLPFSCKFEDIAFSLQKDVSACAGDALHVVVGCTNVAGFSSISLIDYQATGACAGALSANNVLALSATQDNDLPANTNLTINISGSSVIGPAHGVVIVSVNKFENI